MSVSTKKVALFLALSAFTGVGVYHVLKSRKRKQIKRIVNELITIFDRSHVFIKDSAIVREKIRIFIEQGLGKLQVMSDFDMTLSKSLAYGKRGHTSHGAIETSTCMPEGFKEKAASIKAKYHPLEFSIDLTHDEKAALMVEWWETMHDLMIEAKFQKRWIPGVVSECNIVLRDGADEFFRVLKDFHVPLYIISAGIGDIIEEAIEKESSLYSNARIVANYMDFDEMGQLQGFKGEMIHTYNKRDIVNHVKGCFDRTSNCSNLILLGDSLGDPLMADGMGNIANVLKIGFLNDEVDGLLETYKDVYDIVIVQDQTMDIVNVFFKELLKNTSAQHS